MHMCFVRQIRDISTVFTPRCVIYPVVNGFFFHSTVFLSYPGTALGYRIPVTRAATIVFSKAMRFFGTQYLDLFARSDYPRKLLLLLRDNF